MQSSQDSSQTPDLVTLKEVQEAAARIEGVVLRTPLVPFGPPLEDNEYGHPRTWIKAESLQPIGAFKLRGAYNALASLTDEERARGVVSHSSGNHAQGVARAGRLLDTHVIVVMPTGAPALKVERVLADGAEIVFVGPDPDERTRVAHELSEQRGLVLIPSYDDRRIIAGQGTAGLEIAEQVASGGAAAIAPDRTPFTVLVPVGGGGLIGGVATAVKSLRPEARVIGVEPELAADANESFRTRVLHAWAADKTGRTVADGLRTTSLSHLTFAHVVARVDGMLTVGEDEIAVAMAAAVDQTRLVLEPSGAVTLAAWLFHGSEVPADGPVICLASGGNVDPGVFATLVERGRAAGSDRERGADTNNHAVAGGAPL